MSEAFDLQDALADCWLELCNSFRERSKCVRNVMNQKQSTFSPSNERLTQEW
jgi:hypothetical protein